jgi:type VI secretion system secreted protein Hcp
MAVDMFLKLDGVPGESKDKQYLDHIEILSFSFGAVQQGAFEKGTGGGAGKAHIHEPQFTHYFDKASTQLLLMCVTGKAINSGEFIARRSGADGKQQPYMNLKFENMMVSSVQTSQHGHGDDRLSETFSLNFRKFEIIYTTQSNTGAPQKSNPVKYDLQANSSE